VKIRVPGWAGGFFLRLDCCSFSRTFLLLRRGVSRLGRHSCCLGYGPNGFGFLPGMSQVGFGVLFLFPSPPTSSPPTSSPPTSFPDLLPSPSPVSFAASHFLPLFPRLAGSVASWGHSCYLGYGPNLSGVLPGMSPVGVFLLSSFLLPPSSYLAPCGFRLQAARMGRMSWRWIRVAYQVARPAAIARSSCGYWPPWGRTAAISRSKMWACARDLSIRSNSVSSK